MEKIFGKYRPKLKIVSLLIITVIYFFMIAFEEWYINCIVLPALSLALMLLAIDIIYIFRNDEFNSNFINRDSQSGPDEIVFRKATLYDILVEIIVLVILALLIYSVIISKFAMLPGCNDVVLPYEVIFSTLRIEDMSAEKEGCLRPWAQYLNTVIWAYVAISAIFAAIFTLYKK
ncbi:hypothetical protein [Oricola indica]|jgi:uncharacterized membrane protein|uniref:hypothetical protein n=1 Tax=Oricola indica TaxID=2872591 RepID=UPI001CBF6436|nr:hypothetical protein [Oricola indica]